MRRLVLFLLLITPFISFSQNEAAIWYFGENSGLDFNSGVPIVLTDGQINTFEGCSTISDPLGNLLFYTDGVTVWDSTHTIMPNGNGLLGNISSTQSAIIVPKPNSLNQYYIFSVDDRNNFSAFSTNGIRYTTVDMTLNGGLGDVVSSEKNLVLVSQAYEKVTAVRHADNNSFWVVTFIQDQFLAWRIDATGVNTTPVISNVSNAADSRGYLKISPDGSKVACANFGNVHSMMIYDFNNATGNVSNEIQLALDDPNDIPYGVEFSTLSQKLYITTSQLNGNEHIVPGKLLQYDILSPNISTSRVLIHTSNVNTRGAVQLAIDGKIYRALSISGNSQIGTEFLGVINNPEADGLACNYVHDAIDVTIGGSFPTHRVVEGLPPFMTSYFLEPSITANNICFGDSTQFNLYSTTPIDSVIWDFGDPSTGVNNASTLENPTHIFSSSGSFTITATVTIASVTTILSIDITIYDLPVVTTPVTLIQCDDDLDGIVNFNLEEANSLISSETPMPTITYFLTEDDAINNVNIISNPTSFSNSVAATVWARVENASNCFTTAEVILQVTSTTIPSSLMITYNECDDDLDGDDTNGIRTFNFSSATNQILTALLPETNLNVTYYENITDALAEQNSIDPTNYTNTTPTSQQIVVRVDNLNNGCFGLGYHVTLNVDTVPQYDLLSSVEFCFDPLNYAIGIENPLSTYDFVWEDELGAIIGNTPNITVNSTGLFTVTATNSSGNNCEKTKSIQVTINDLPIITSPVTLVQCDDDIDGVVDFNLNEANSLISTNYLNETFTFYTDLTGAENADSNFLITNSTSFSNSTASNIWVRIENAANCFSIAEITLQVTSTNIPNDLMIVFNECDQDNNNTDGITTLNFSSVTNQISDALLPETNLIITYYQNITDALAELNRIDETNYTNNTSPFTQQLVVRVDDLMNDCFGLGFHVTLNINNPPEFDLLNTVTLCLNSENPTISVENPVDVYEYIWRNEQDIIIGYTPEVIIDLEGTYTVTATDTNGNNCETTKSIVVSSAPITPLLNFSINNILITDNSSNNTITVLTSNLPNGNYEFALDGGDFQFSNFFENIPAGIHTVNILEVNNCLEASVDVSLIGIPNFFTPNEDGYNDTWHVTGIEFQPTSNVYVFNRFGKLIVILKPLGPGWDGLYKGNPLPSTDYWYKVELEDGRVLKGHFSLIRR